MSSPEELARQNIDALLTQCGWIIQKRSEINLSAGRGIAISEGLLSNSAATSWRVFHSLKKLRPSFDFKKSRQRFCDPVANP
jgi:hypothetical protein